jgi:prevent-host-death family protein
MTVTLQEAQADLPGLVAKAVTGEEVFIVSTGGQPTVKLVAAAAKGSRLVQHPQVERALRILDHEALVKPLPAEEWGQLAER